MMVMKLMTDRWGCCRWLTEMLVTDGTTVMTDRGDHDDDISSSVMTL